MDTRHADTAKDKRTGRRVGPRPVPKRPAAHSRAMVVLAHDSSHMPFPSCSKLHTRTHSQARTHGASNCQRGIYVSLPCERARACSHTLRLTAREQPPDRPTWQWWYPSSQRERPVCQSASESMCDNAAPLPSRRERSSTFVRRKPWPLAQQAVTTLASSGKTARFRTYTLRRGRR